MGLDDIQSAIRLRDFTTKVAEGVINKLRPEVRIGKVYGLSTNQTALILFPGETIDSLVEAHFASNMQPSVLMSTNFQSQGYAAPSDIVRVAGGPGSYYILDYLSGNPISLYNSVETTFKRAMNIATYQETISNGTGYMIIETNLQNTNQMLRIDVKGWDYSDHNNIIDLTFTMYPYEDDFVYSYDYKNNGTAKFSSVLILKNTSNGKIAIALQRDSGFWQYPKLAIDAWFGHVWVDTTKLSGWRVFRAANLSAYETMRTLGDDPILTKGVLSPSQIANTHVWTLLTAWSLSQNHPFITYSAGSFTITRTGFYDLRFTAMFRNEWSSNGVRGVGIYLNGIQISGAYSAPIVGQADYVSAGCSTVYYVPNGGVITFQVLNTAGGFVTVHGAPWTECTLLRVNG